MLQRKMFQQINVNILLRNIILVLLILQTWNEKMLAPLKKSYDKSRQCIKKKRHHFIYKGPNSQSYGFSTSHVWMWELGHKEG